MACNPKYSWERRSRLRPAAQESKTAFGKFIKRQLRARKGAKARSGNSG
jgi:hypothetical protein